MLRRSNNAAGDALAARETHRDKTCMDVVGSDLSCRCLAHGLCRQPRIGSVARDTTQAAENVRDRRTPKHGICGLADLIGLDCCRNVVKPVLGVCRAQPYVLSDFWHCGM